MAKSSPSIKSIADVFRISRARAQLIHDLILGKIGTGAFKLNQYERQYPVPEKKLLCIAKCIGSGTYGVELLAEGGYTSPQRTDGSDIVAYYINTGDTYSPTILYNCLSGTYRITTWGDFYERHSSLFESEFR